MNNQTLIKLVEIQSNIIELGCKLAEERSKIGNIINDIRREDMKGGN